VGRKGEVFRRERRRFGPGSQACQEELWGRQKIRKKSGGEKKISVRRTATPALLKKIGRMPLGVRPIFWKTVIKKWGNFSAEKGFSLTYNLFQRIIKPRPMLTHRPGLWLRLIGKPG
jgi:hypothetical protein